MKLYVNEDRTVLVRVYDDPPEWRADVLGPLVEVATRPDSDAVWGPPVMCTQERTA